MGCEKCDFDALPRRIYSAFMYISSEVKMKKMLENFQLDIFVLHNARCVVMPACASSKLLAPTQEGPPELTIRLLLHMCRIHPGRRGPRNRISEKRGDRQRSTAHLFLTAA